jgi:hypothetical protein
MKSDFGTHIAGQVGVALCPLPETARLSRKGGKATGAGAHGNGRDALIPLVASKLRDAVRDNPEVSVRSRGKIAAAGRAGCDLIETGLS